MEDRTLVAYASRDGATQEIAEAIADELRRAGVDVVLADAGGIDDLGEFRAVVLGSAVYMGRWRPEARRFLKKHSKELGERPVWLFSSGPVGDEDPPDDSRFAEPPFVKRHASRIGARDHVVFGGRLRTDSTSFMARSMAEKMPEETRDLRDWDEIRAWARKIALARLEGPELLV
jgi:menaquinone-dependent protoporphyrinogen oxidase